MKAPARLISYISFFLVLLLCVAMLLTQYISLINESQQREALVLYKDFITQIRDKGRTAVNIAATLANQENVKEAMAKKERENLEQIMLPTWHLLKTQYNVKQFQFHTPKGESFKRMHAPDEYGDSLITFRHTLVAALNNKTSIVGLEKGVYGVGIRGVVPILGEDGEVLGSVELGFSFDEAFLNNFASDIETEVAVYFRNDESFELYASTMDQNQLRNNNLSSVYEQTLNFWEHTINNKHFLFSSGVVNDFSGSNIGYVVFRIDREFYHQSLLKAYFLAGSILFIGLILVIAIYFVNRSIMRRREQVERQKNQLEQSEEKNKNMLNYIIEKEKISSLNQVVAGVAHEINTPLGVSITANSYLRSKLDKLDSEFTNNTLASSRLEKFIDTSRESIDLVDNSLSRINHLISRFKELSTKNGESSKNQFNITEIIDYVVKSFENKIRQKGLKIVFDIDDSIYLKGNSVEFINIVNQAISNTIQHGSEPEKKVILNISTHKNSDGFILEFADNGPGVDSELLQHLFEPFYTTARSEQCTGLGLNIIYNTVIHNLNGRVEVISPTQKGSGFAIQIHIPSSNIVPKENGAHQSAVT